MNLQDKYDELDEIISELELLEKRIVHYKDFKEQLEFIRYEAENELEEIEPELQEMYDREEMEMNYQYERSVL